MRPAPIEIRLGDKKWVVRPLTASQIEAIEDVVTGPVAGGAKFHLAIIKCALSRDFANDAASLGDTEMTVKEIGDASSAVLTLGGFTPSKDGAPGEAQAGQEPASTGTASEAV